MNTQNNNAEQSMNEAAYLFSRLPDEAQDAILDLINELLSKNKEKTE